MTINNTQIITLNLNPEQKKAVTAPLNQSVLVIAGAGSGKTSVLTKRIAYLIDQGVSPNHILAVTFTNKAAREMTTRLQALSIPTHNLWMGTFHGLGYRIIKQHFRELGLPHAGNVLDKQDQLSYFKKVLKANGIEPKGVNVEDVIASINGFKEKGMRSNVVKNQAVQQYYQMYEEKALADGALDFSELLIGSFEILQKPHINQYYSQKFQYILVDEFQDTNLLQYEWLMSLAKVHQNIFVVGDFDQSIYSFRGAYPKNLFRIQKDFNNLMEVKLEQNYRSFSYILEAANNLITKNTQRQPKNLWTQKKNQDKIIYKNAYNDLDESMYIGDTVNMWHRQGVDYKDMAILYRTNALSRNLERVFMSRNIPFMIYGGLRFFERQEIKNAVAYLRLALNKQDNLAFSRIINVPARGIGDTSLQQLEVLSIQNKQGLWNCVPLLKAKTQEKFVNFINFMTNLGNDIKKMPLKDQIKYVVENCGLKELYEEKNESERIDNLYELIAAATMFSQENPDLDVNDFLNYCQLDGDFDKIQQNKHLNIDAVQMMTVHAAKGLEFPIIFLVGLNEMVFPHFRAIDKDDELEEERRLMYVAMTRAKDHLYFTSCESRFFQGTGQDLIPSRFIYEIPENLIKKSH